MKLYKRTAALLMSLAICAAGTFPVGAALAAGEEDTTAAADEFDELYEIGENSGNKAADLKTSGEFSYSLTTGGDAIIENCTSTADELVIPAEIDGLRVAELGKGAFGESPAKKITIPASVEYISADNPFARCENLAEVEVAADSEYYTVKDGVLFTKDMTRLVVYPRGISGSSYTVPEGVEEIGAAAFYVTQLSSISLPPTVTAVEHHAFAENSKLTELDMSSCQIRNINDMAFLECGALSSVKLSPDTQTIGLAAFYRCKALENIDLPDGLKHIEQSAFMGTGLTQIKIPESVEFIGYSAFGYDENEEPVEGFTLIGKAGGAAETYAKDSDDEYNYKNDFEFISSEYAEEWEAYMDMDTVIEGDYEYFTENGEATLVFCSSTDYAIMVPDTLGGCPVTKINTHAFITCGSSEIILPETVKTIGVDAFRESLVSLTIPGSCTEIEGDEPFVSCTYLRKITVTEGSGNYSSLDGVLYNKDKSELVAYPLGKADEEFTAPASVRKVRKSAFCNNPFIARVDISGVTAIETYAFEGCTALERVKFSKDLVSVGADAFYGCTALKSVRLYDKLETLGEYCFGFYFDEEAAKAAQDAANNLGGIMNPDTKVPTGDVVVSGFKIYADKDTLGYNYANANDIEVVTGTVEVGSKNVSKGFLGVVFGAIGAALIALIGILTGKSLKKKKAEKEREERRKKSQEKAADAVKEADSDAE